MDWEKNLSISTAALAISDQDVEELRHERSVRGFKSFEEIESLTVDENLSLLDRTLLLLSTGQEVQRINSIQNLHELLKEDKVAFLQRVNPVFCDAIQKGSQDLNLTSAKEITKIVELELLSGMEFVQTFLSLILENYDHSNPVISRAWQGTLLSVIPFLPSEVINEKILSMAKSIGNLTQRVHLRLACCSLVGKLAINLDNLDLKKDLMSLVKTLCQDIEFEVRASMCKQLSAVAKGVGQELTKTQILPELIELTNDEETIVRQTGLETVSEMLSLLDDDCCTDQIIPMVKKIIIEVIERDQEDELVTICKHIGKLAHGLAVNLSREEVRWFLDVFRTLAVLKTGDINKNFIKSGGLKIVYFSACSIVDDLRAECRRWCGYNFPAMVLFAGKFDLEKDLLPSFKSLVNDSHYLVRKTIACGVHEICKLLNTNAGLIQSEVKILLEDDSIDVLQGLITSLATTLQILAEEVNISELIAPLLSAELSVGASHNWRLHVKLLEIFECLPDCLTSEQIFYKFVPVLFRLLSSNRVLPVKLAAGRTLCVFVKYNKRSDQRKDLCNRIVNELGKGRNYHLRNLYLDICRFIMELFSKQFFKDYFFEFSLQLAFDAVVNVRIKFCELLPALKSQIKLPSNRLLLQQLENCCRQMMASESDRDVSASVRKAVVQMDSIELAQDIGGLSKNQEDIADKIKEDHEKKLLEQERNLDNLTNSKGHGDKMSTVSASRKRAPLFSQVTKDVTRKVAATGLRVKDATSKQTNSSKSDGSISNASSTSKGQPASRLHTNSISKAVSTVEVRRKSSSGSSSLAKSTSAHGAGTKEASKQTSSKVTTESKGPSKRSVFCSKKV